MSDLGHVNPYESPELPPEDLNPTAPRQTSPETRIVVISVAICVFYDCKQFFFTGSSGNLTYPNSLSLWLSLLTFAAQGAWRGLGLAAIVLAGTKRQFYSFQSFRRWIRRLSPGGWIAILTFIPLASETLAGIWEHRPDPSVAKSLDPNLAYLIDIGASFTFCAFLLIWSRESRLWRVTAGIHMSMLAMELLKRQLWIWAPPDGWFEPWYWTLTNGAESLIFLAWVAAVSGNAFRDLHLNKTRDNLHWASITLTFLWPLGQLLTDFASHNGL